MLAAQLGVETTSAALRVHRTTIRLHPGATAFVGETAGYHGTTRRAWVAELDSGLLIPLGGTADRHVLQDAYPPTSIDDSLPEYVATLAALEGAVPPLATPVADPQELPSWMLEFAAEHGIELQAPVVQELAGGLREVRVMVQTDALYLVVAVVGQRRYDDSLKEVRPLIGYPPG
jgi:hypothetical protein